MPTEEQVKAGYQDSRNSTIKTVIPSPAELAALEPHVEVHRTTDGVEFVRTPESRFEPLQDYPWLAKGLEKNNVTFLSYSKNSPRGNKE